VAIAWLQHLPGSWLPQSHDCDIHVAVTIARLAHSEEEIRYRRDFSGKYRPWKMGRMMCSNRSCGSGGKEFGTEALFEHTLVPQKQDFLEDAARFPGRCRRKAKNKEFH